MNDALTDPRRALIAVLILSILAGYVATSMFIRYAGPDVIGQADGA